MSARNLRCSTRMWGLVFLVCTLLPSLMCKEFAPTVDVSEDEKNMIYKIIKRLELNDKRSQAGRLRNSESDSVTTTGRPSATSTQSSESESKDAVSESCVSQLNVKTNQQTIIKTDDSITNGAVFVGEFLLVASNEICVERCCRNVSCDTAVYEEKGQHNCYLFQCRGRCKFDEHGSYVSTEMVRPAPPLSSPAPIADDSEDDGDLDSIFSDAEGTDQDVDGDASESSKSPEPVRPREGNSTTSTTTTAVTTSTSAASTAPFIKSHSVMLGGMCHRNLHCKDPGAECNFKQCICRQGYRYKDGVCREQCPVGSFECQSPVQEDIQCISDQERCDSIQQCADGSDELNCFFSRALPVNSWEHHRPSPSQSETQTSLPQLEAKTSLPALQSSRPPEQRDSSFLERQHSPIGSISASEWIEPENSTGQGNSGMWTRGVSGPAQAGGGQGDPPVQSLDLFTPQLSGPVFQEEGRPMSSFAQDTQNAGLTSGYFRLDPTDGEEPDNNAGVFAKDLGLPAEGTGPSDVQQLTGSGQQFPADQQEIPGMYPQYSPGPQPYGLQLQSGDFEQQFAPSLPAYHDQLVDSEQTGSASDPFRESFYDPGAQQSHQILPQVSQTTGPLMNPSSQIMNKRREQSSRLLDRKRGWSEGVGQPTPSQMHYEGNMDEAETESHQSGDLTSEQQDPTNFDSSKSSGSEAPRQIPVTSVLYSIHGKPWASHRAVGASPQDQLLTRTSSVGMDGKYALTTMQHSPLYGALESYTAYAESHPDGLQTPQPYQIQNSDVRHRNANAGPSSQNPDGLNASSQLHPGGEDRGVYQEGNTNSGFYLPQNSFGKLDSSNSGSDNFAGGQESSMFTSESHSVDEQPEDSSEKENPQKPDEDNSKENQSSPKEEQQEESQSSSEEDQETSSKDKEEKNPDSSEEEDQHADVDSSQSSADKNTSTIPTTTTTTTTADGGFMSKFEKAVDVGDLQLPIIALSVGLSVTLFLLIFVGCRLRRVRRQLRKGRPLHGNEADYLINGMYL